MDIIRSLAVSFIAFLSSLGTVVAPAVNQITQNLTQPTQTQNFQPGTPAASSDTSRNWAGYSANNGTFTGVSGTWTVPQLNSNGNYGADAAWVGIGGVNSRDLIQAGTQGTVSRNGQVSYQAFFETLPQASQPLQIDLNGGDSVTASLNQQAQGVWKITFRDNTTGQSTEIDQSYDSSLSSADWIEEAPSGIRRIMPLDNFGTIQFTNASAVKNGESVKLAQAGAQAIAMGGFGQTLASASVLGSDGASFSVNRNNNQAIAQSPQSQQYPQSQDPQSPQIIYGFGGYGIGGQQGGYITHRAFRIHVRRSSDDF